MAEKSRNVTVYRLFIGFISVILLFVAFGVISLIEIRTLSKVTRTIYDHPLVVSNSSLRATVSMIKMHRSMKDVTLLEFPSEINTAISAVNEQERIVFESLDNVKKNILGDKGQQLENETRYLFVNWKPIREKVIKLVRKGQREEAAKITIGKGAGHVVKLENKMLELTSYARNKATGFIQHGEKVRSRIIDTTIILISIGILLSVFIAFFTIRRTQAADEEIRRGKILLESSIESPKDMIILSLDCEYRYLYFNKTHAESMRHVFGTRPKIGDCIFDHMKGKDDIEKVKEHYDRALVGEGHVAIEEYGEGQVRFYYEIQYNPVYDGKNEIIGVTSFAQNITERQQMEEALRESELRLRLSINNMLEAYALHEAIFDENGRMVDYRFLEFNPMAQKIANIAREKIVGKTAVELFPNVVERGLMDRYADVMATGESAIIEDFYYAGDSLDMALDIACFRIDDLHFVCVFRDITERKRAEEALRLSEEKHKEMIANIPDVIAIMDSNGIIIYKSPNIEKWFGWHPDDLVGTDGWETVHPDDLERIQGEFFNLLAKDKSVKTVEYRYKCKDGSHKMIELTAINLTQDSIVNGVLMNYHDISARILAEKEKEKLESQLQQAQKMESIGTLAGGIAHDFNNILSPIMIHSEMAKMALPADSSVQHNLSEIYMAGERARDMVKQILTFSRKKEGERAVIKTIPILKEVLKMLRSSIPTTIDIQQNMEAESDTVFADPTQIHQIMLNLGTNAAHAMRAKGGTLKVSLDQKNLDSEAAAQHPDLNPGSYLKLTVSDTGSGIDDETMPNIFEPYFTTKEVGEGTGMGLALIHGIVKSYGGDITVESELGKGTTFNVYLPRVEADVSPAEAPSIKLPRGTERILFVDDEKSAIDAIQPMLEIIGYKVTARTSSIEALEAFRNDPEGFDLVITDMTMPNMTGKDLAKELMSIRSDIPIILCTGFSEQIDENIAKGMGIRKYIMKPIVMGDVAKLIRDVLDEMD